MSTVIACSISILALFGWAPEKREISASQVGGEAIIGALLPATADREPREGEAWLDAVVAAVVAAAGNLVDF